MLGIDITKIRKQYVVEGILEKDDKFKVHRNANSPEDASRIVKEAKDSGCKYVALLEVITITNVLEEFIISEQGES